MPSDTRDFEVIVWGATGFTGRLVAEYLYQQYGVDGELRWAMAGRNQQKLESVRDELGEGANKIPLLIANSDNAYALEALAGKTRALCTTVGPFAKYGEKLVAACVKQGTHYCDITGEVHWVQEIIDRYQEQAEASGARIVSFCGFDSVPSDLGVQYVQEVMQQRHGVSASKVKAFLTKLKGSFSGGTFESMLTAVEAAIKNPEIRSTLGNPYSINPAGERKGPDGSDQMGPCWDADLNAWSMPFVMASTNTRVVRRSNALMQYAYGKAFRYEESALSGKGASGYLKSLAASIGSSGFLLLAAIKPTRSMLRNRLRSPGEGPSEEERIAGEFSFLLIGKHPQNPEFDVRIEVSADRDPGYGATCKMLGESVVCLAKDEQAISVGGGCWTPASCMGSLLRKRLEANAGMTFKVVD